MPKKEIKYEIKTPGTGVYLLVMEGIAKINGITLNKRGAFGVYTTSSITIETEAESRLLIMHTPNIISQQIFPG